MGKFDEKMSNIEHFTIYWIKMPNYDINSFILGFISIYHKYDNILEYCKLFL
jgi:hypothetical protein